MSKLSKWVVAIILILAVSVGTFMVKSGNKPLPVEVREVKKQDIEENGGYQWPFGGRHPAGVFYPG